MKITVLPGDGIGPRDLGGTLGTKAFTDALCGEISRIA